MPHCSQITLEIFQLLHTMLPSDTLLSCVRISCNITETLYTLNPLTFMKKRKQRRAGSASFLCNIHLKLKCIRLTFIDSSQAMFNYFCLFYYLLLDILVCLKANCLFLGVWPFQWPVLWHAATNTSTDKTHGAVNWCWEQKWGHKPGRAGTGFLAKESTTGNFSLTS